MCAHECGCPQKPEADLGSLRASGACCYAHLLRVLEKQLLLVSAGHLSTAVIRLSEDTEM